MDDVWPTDPPARGRLRLRTVEKADLPDLLVVNGDDETTRFLPYDSWKDMQDAEAWLQRMQTLCAGDTARQLVIERVADARVIGSLLLFRHERPSSRLEIGYVLGRPFWRQGHAREALCLALDTILHSGAIRRVEAEVNPLNTASDNLLRSLGFRHEGVLRERWVAKGRAYDVNFFGLLASEWRTAAQ